MLGGAQAAGRPLATLQTGARAGLRDCNQCTVKRHGRPKRNRKHPRAARDRRPACGRAAGSGSVVGRALPAGGPRWRGPREDKKPAMVRLRELGRMQQSTVRTVRLPCSRQLMPWPLCWPARTGVRKPPAWRVGALRCAGRHMACVLLSSLFRRLGVRRRYAERWCQRAREGLWHCSWSGDWAGLGRLVGIGTV